MSKGKKIYFLVLLLITILVTTFYFSYAIFSNTQEEHGKLNIVAGTLNYKIESSELDSDSITLEANTSKEIKIKLTSLNEVSSKYELYYILDKTNNKVSVGYSKDTKDNVLGTIEGSSSKVITVVVRNDSDTSSKVTFKVLGGLVNNELALKDGNSLNQELALCNYEKGYVWNFDYTGGEQEFTTPCSGEYKLETWGAQGGYGSYGTGTKIGGYGAYSFGNISTVKENNIFINIGGKGGQYNAGYNGGGKGAFARSSPEYSGGGGGATHIAKTSGILSALENSKKDIFIVASGGGGGSTCATEEVTNVLAGGSGGGIIGNSNIRKTNYGASQTNGGTNLSGVGNYGTFGQGGHGYVSNLNRCESVGGGGGGFYGGASNNYSGSGGSSYIGNSLLTDKAMYCYNCQESSEESTKTISTTCVSETPTSNCSKQGNGYARITYLGN